MRTLRWAAFLGLLCGLALAARPVSAQEPAAEEKPIPPKFALEAADEAQRKVYDAVKARMMTLGPEQVTSIAGSRGFGERVGSVMAPMLETFVWGYRYSGDKAWLERFAAVMGALEKALVTDPDGGQGWYSLPDTRKFSEPYPPRWPDNDLMTAWQQSEARVAAACADFALTVHGDGDLAEKFADKADRWIELVENKLMPKWEKGEWLELSDERAVFTWPQRALKRSTKDWAPYPVAPKEGENITLPHPAVSETARAYLKLWQLKGTSDYRSRAAQLLRWQKSCLRPGKGGTYWWNFWDPAGDWDFKPEGGLAFGMYLSPEPLHAARDVEAFVEAYHCGVVFDKADLDRLLKTQTGQMLAGGETPSWRNMQGQGRGAYWAPLAEFDERLRELLPRCLDWRSNEYGSILRFRQECYQWDDGKRRKLSPPGLNSGSMIFEAAKEAEVITWRKTYNDFKKEMEDLIRKHPPPDPTKRQRPGAAG